MGFDPLFKKMYGDVNYTNKAAALVGIVLSIPYEDIKDRIDVVGNEKLRNNKSDKQQERDVLLRIQLHSEYHFVNLEANLFGYNQELIDRNASYISDIYSSQLDESDGYSLLNPVIQINFNKPINKIKTGNPYDVYTLRSDDDHVLTDMIKIINVDIVKCFDLWYNGGIEKFTSSEQNIIRVGALHFISNDDDFRKCLGEIKMDKDVKNKIERDMDEYQRDKNLVRVYDAQKRRDAEWDSLFRDLYKDRDLLNDERQQFDEEKQQFDEERQQFNENRQQFDEKKQQFDEEKQQFDEDKRKLDKDKKQINMDKELVDDEKRKLLQEKINIAKVLKDTGVSIEEISNRLNLTIDEINDYI